MFFQSQIPSLHDSFLIGGVTIPPSAPAILTPNSTTESTFLARWSPAAGATGYRIDVATDLLFSSFVSGWNNTDVGNVTSVRVTGVVPGLLFYRVRAYNLGGTSASSAAMNASYFTLVRALNTSSALNFNDAGGITPLVNSDNNASGLTGWMSQGVLFANNAQQVVSFNIWGIDSAQTGNPPYDFVDGDTAENGPDYNGPINGDSTPGGGAVGFYCFDFDATGHARKSTSIPVDFQNYNFDGTASGLPFFNLLNGTGYDNTGQQFLAIPSGKKYQITWGPNDTSATVGFGGGAQHFFPPFTQVFTANSGTITLVGTPNAPITTQLLQLN